MIDLQDITFTYPGQTTPLFDRFTWRVERGEFWSVIGPSGCGKSTLLHLVVGVRAPQSGSITVNGENVPRKKNRGKTGLVLQDYGMLPWSTVRENVRLGLRIREFYHQGDANLPLRGRILPEAIPNSESETPALDFSFGKVGASVASLSGAPSLLSGRRSPRNDMERVDFWLERFGLGDQGNKYPNQISGGQRQRAAIARTLVLEPDVLLMDEPFSALDAPTREDLEQVTLDLQAETQTTTVFVTHNIEEAVFLGRKILVLGDPPHCSPVRCVDNPGAGRAEYRDEEVFLEQTHRLREMLKSKA